MFQQLLQTLFGQDQRFLVYRTEGIPHGVRDALRDFWADPDLAPLVREVALVPEDYKQLLGMLEDFARARFQWNEPALWREVAFKSQVIAKEAPEAASLASLQALAAWVGGLGDRLFLQPWTGHDAGWHLFPLALSRNLAMARAVWAGRFICETAFGFIESAKNAPFDPSLRAVLSEYAKVMAKLDSLYDNAVAELAWALRSAAVSQRPNFRAELAALFWTTGDVVHADLVGPEGPPGYLPSAALVRDLVGICLRRLPRDPLIQYIWLEMKDRPPFSLRDHEVLFGMINNRYRSRPVHMHDEMFPVSPSWAFARAAIGMMCGQVEKETLNALRMAFQVSGPVLSSEAPDIHLRLCALVNLVDVDDCSQRAKNWRSLAASAAAIVEWADHNGIYEPFDRTLDIPFYYLATSATGEAEQALDAIELYRQSNMRYWLDITPPSADAIEDAGRAETFETLQSEERLLLKELRGARFIRLLPHLPQHYRRYGFNLDEVDREPPEGAETLSEGVGALRFDPFDQVLANRTLRDARERLSELHERMRSVAPPYAAQRREPPSSADALITALRAHRAGV